MSANPEPRHDARESYSYPRRLSASELVPVLAIAVGAGLVAFYIARLLKARTPLVADSASRGPRPRRSAGAKG
jgi:hypothetical protein